MDESVTETVQTLAFRPLKMVPDSCYRTAHAGQGMFYDVTLGNIDLGNIDLNLHVWEFIDGMGQDCTAF